MVQKRKASSSSSKNTEKRRKTSSKEEEKQEQIEDKTVEEKEEKEENENSAETKSEEKKGKEIKETRKKDQGKGKVKRKKEKEEEEEKEEEKKEEEEEEKERPVTYNVDAKNVRELGYKFNEKNKLVTLNNDTFTFIHQEHYNLLSTLVASHIQDMMKKTFGMEEVWLPLRDKNYNKPQVNIFLSKDALTNPEKLMVLICGTGQVLAGQWARRLCINDSLDTGSILPYLEKCKELGYGVIVLNPNAISVLKKLEGPKKENGVYVKRKGHNGLSEEYESISVEENETEFAHVNYVWEHFISKSVAHNLVFVAHSFGGYLATQLIADKEQEIFSTPKARNPSRLRAVALTDSVHTANKKWSGRIKSFFLKHCVNFACSTELLGTPIKVKNASCIVVSAGTKVHEESSSSCMELLFDFLEDRIEDQPKQRASKESKESKGS